MENGVRKYITCVRSLFEPEGTVQRLQQPGTSQHFEEMDPAHSITLDSLKIYINILLCFTPSVSL
jgi:hypothetical protein